MEYINNKKFRLNFYELFLLWEEMNLNLRFKEIFSVLCVIILLSVKCEMLCVIFCIYYVLVMLLFVRMLRFWCIVVYGKVI